MEIEFYSEELKRVYEINKERIEIDQKHLEKVNADIATLEKYLRNNFKEFKENFYVEFEDCTIEFTRLFKNTKLRLCHINEKGEYEPIVEAKLSKRLKFYKHLPAFLNAITNNFYKKEQL